MTFQPIKFLPLFSPLVNVGLQFKCNSVANGDFGFYIAGNMSLLRVIREKKKARSLKAALCILLLFFYVAGASQIESLHLFFHSHNIQVSHSNVQEKDPCHKAIYHQEIEKGCGHHSHILDTDKCELCDIIFHKDQILLSTFESKPLQFFTIDIVFSSQGIVGTGQPALPSRAPPAV